MEITKRDVVLFSMVLVSVFLALHIAEKREANQSILSELCTAQTWAVITATEKQNLYHRYGGEQVEYYYVTTYEYTVDEVKYALTEERHESYAPQTGARVTLHYDPYDPKKAYIGSVPPER